MDRQPSSTLTPGDPELTPASSGTPDIPSENQHLLLPNGHLPRASDPGPESTALMGQPPGRRHAPLPLAPST